MALLTLLLANAAPGLAQELRAGNQLVAGETLRSADGRFSLAMQTDGNLVLYYGDRVQWATYTAGGKGTRCAMQEDGNLVVYSVKDDKPVALWNAGSAGGADSKLVCQNDGNLVVYSGGKATWSSGTWDPGKYAKLVVKRPDLYSYPELPIGAYVNDRLVGTVMNNKTEEFPFLPAADGRNTVVFVVHDKSDPDRKHKEYAGRKSAGSAAVAHAGGEVKSVLDFDGLGGRIVDHTAAVSAGHKSHAVVGIELKEEMVERVVHTETITAIRGVKWKASVSRTVEYGVEVKKLDGLEGGAGLDLKVFKLDIRKRVEDSLSHQYKQSETITQELEVDGNVVERVEVIWVEKFLVGTAKVRVSDQEVSVPFEFRGRLELRFPPAPGKR